MDETALDTAVALLEGVVERSDDPEVTFRVRTALQLLVVVAERTAGTQEVLATADLDPEVRDRLRRLGYVE